VFPHKPRRTFRRDVEARETLESLRSFKVSASVSEAATSRLGLRQNFERLGLVSETWVSGLVSVSAQKVSCSFLVVALKKKKSLEHSAYSIYYLPMTATKLLVVSIIGTTCYILVRNRLLGHLVINLEFTLQSVGSVCVT